MVGNGIDAPFREICDSNSEEGALTSVRGLQKLIENELYATIEAEARAKDQEVLVTAKDLSGITWGKHVDCTSEGHYLLHYSRVSLSSPMQVENQDDEYFDLVVGGSAAEMRADAWHELIEHVFSPVVITLAGAIFLAGGLSIYITWPIKCITKVARRITRAEIDHVDTRELPTRNRTEVGELARTFEELLRVERERTRLLRENQSRLQQILDTALDGILTIHEMGKIQSFNHAAEKILEVTRPETIGQDFPELHIRPMLRQNFTETCSDFARSARRPSRESQ